jgi:4-carboxymuconolactone decarboxylase
VSVTPRTSSARNEVRQVAPKLIELSESVLYADVWERPGLSKRDRSLITVAALMATSSPGISSARAPTASRARRSAS